MRITNNITALRATNIKARSNEALSKSIRNIASGKRVDSASDDAAGLSISQKMRAQIRGLTQASKNALDGISLIQTADGAIDEMTNITQRIRELCVQASNATLTDDDRLKIQLELDQNKLELSRISNHTEFNTRRLLDGTLGTSVQKEKIEWVTIEETIYETVTETVFETTKELQEKTIVTYSNEKVSANLDLDLSAIDKYGFSMISIGEDTLFLNLIRQNNNTISVSLTGDGNDLVKSSHSATTSPISLALSQFGGPGYDGLIKSYKHLMGAMPLLDFQV